MWRRWRRLSRVSGAGVLGRGERLHRQRVDLLAHPVAEGAVDALVAGDPVRSLELRGDDGGEEMAAVAFDLEVLAGEVGGDEALDVARGGVGHRPMLSRRPPQSAPGPLPRRLSSP